MIASSRRVRGVAWGALAALTALVALTATAAADHECARLQAEARSEAVLLYAPRLQLEGARAPGVTEAADPSSAGVDGLQARASLALSPIDMLRGRALERVADAQCAIDAVAHRLDRVLATGPRYGELAATRAELDYLDAHLGEIDALVAEVADALARQRATALELDDLRNRRATLRRRANDLRNTRALLTELDGEGDADVPDLAGLAATARAATLHADRRRAAVRDLSAWHVDVRAGVAGAERADFFAVVEIGYSLGERWQKQADRRALQARGAALANDERSVVVRAERLRRAMADSVTVLDVEVRELDDELATLTAERTRFENLDSDAARALRNRSTLARIELEARRVSVSTLAAARRSLVGATP